MIRTERARQDEDVGIGITSIGVTSKKLGVVFCQGPIYNKNIFKQGLDRKTESAFQKLRFLDSDNVFLAEAIEYYAFTKTKA
jgi:hypothetical protein